MTLQTPFYLYTASAEFILGMFVRFDAVFGGKMYTYSVGSTERWTQGLIA